MLFAFQHVETQVEGHSRLKYGPGYGTGDHVILNKVRLTYCTSLTGNSIIRILIPDSISTFRVLINFEFKHPIDGN